LGPNPRTELQSAECRSEVDVAMTDRKTATQ